MGSLFNWPKGAAVAVWRCPMCREEFFYCTPEELKTIKHHHGQYHFMLDSVRPTITLTSN